MPDDLVAALAEIRDLFGFAVASGLDVAPALATATIALRRRVMPPAPAVPVALDIVEISGSAFVVSRPDRGHSRGSRKRVRPI